MEEKFDYAKAVAELEAVSNPDYFAYSEEYRKERVQACRRNLREMMQCASGRSLEFCTDGGILRLFWCYNIDGVEVYCLQRVIYPEGTVI